MLTTNTPSPGPSPAEEAQSYLFQVGHGTGVAARVLLNDLPMYTGAGQQNITVSGPANHLLLPGENTLTLELFPAPRPLDAPTIEGPVAFTLRLDDAEGTIVHRVKWPDCWEALAEEHQVLPFAHASRFVADELLARPVYWDVAPVDFPLEGTPDLHLAVMEYSHALARRDVDAFLEANALKLAERQRANPGHSELDRGVQRQKLQGYLGRDWQLRPARMEELVFERRAGGRVAYVTRKDGGHAVEAFAADDPSETFAVDLFLTRHEGRWRVFR